MKSEKHYLILGVVTGILLTCGLCNGQLPGRDEPEPVLIGHPNPTLAGIEKLNVDIVPPDSEPNKDGLVWRELEAKVINKLNEAGIKIIPGIAGNILNIDELRVYIDMLKFADSQIYVFRIQISLARAVYLAKDSSWSIKADVWKTKPVMQAASAQDTPPAVTNLVLQQVEAFICAYRVANSQPDRSADANDTSAVSVTTSRPSIKQVMAEYEYVASKNSEVFHKPDCRWAKKISPKNLVGYDTKAEAIKAGKRPCRGCKP